VIVLWPNVSMTTRGETPWTSINVAAVWRRSWNRNRGRPAACNACWNRSVTLEAEQRAAHYEGAEEQSWQSLERRGSVERYR
jgi:hypothetical protein